MSGSTTLTMNTLNQKLNTNHIFIDEISWMSTIKIIRRPIIPHLGQGTEASNGMKDSIKVL